MSSSRFFQTRARLAAGTALFAASTVFSGCAPVPVLYVDAAPQEIPVAAISKVRQPKPVTLHFEVQDKGVAAARGTERMKDIVLAEVKDSGLFSRVDTKSSAGNNLLTITLNKVRITGKPGEAMTDRFICTSRYQRADSEQSIAATAEQLIYTLPAQDKPPPGSRKADSALEAMTVMARTVISHTLDELARRPEFD